MTDVEHTVETALAALTQGDFAGVVEQLDDQFVFIDHAIELEFTDKAQLIDFLTLNRKLFPDSERTDKIICSSGDLVVTEWALTGTKREQYFGRMFQLPFHARGVSIVQIDGGKISRWSEYYDQTLSRRYSLAASFVEINEL
jgi:steroid delta-isomerase-like uncharacterized protein